MHPASDIEMIQNKFLRRLLGVKNSTNLSALYGETGRVPLFVFRKIIMIKYWVKIVSQDDSSLLKQIYFMLKEDADVNRNYSGKNWASNIKSILQEHGFGYVWNDQLNSEIPFTAIRQRIFDTYHQKWYSDINNSNGLQSYCLFKHDFKLESYLTDITENKYKIALARFRTSSHSLMFEKGRYDDSPRQQRLCKSCNMNQIENEYHFLLVCPYHRDLRSKYLKPYFCHWPSLNKFEVLLSSSSKKVISNLAKYIYFANRNRVL